MFLGSTMIDVFPCPATASTADVDDDDTAADIEDDAATRRSCVTLLLIDACCWCDDDSEILTSPESVRQTWASVGLNFIPSSLTINKQRPYF
jgi:hypothetical protein